LYNFVVFRSLGSVLFWSPCSYLTQNLVTKHRVSQTHTIVTGDDCNLISSSTTKHLLHWYYVRNIQSNYPLTSGFIWLLYCKGKGRMPQPLQPKLVRILKHSVRTSKKTQHFTKMTAFRDIAPCSLVGVHRRFRGVYCLHHQGDDRPDNEGSAHLRNVGLLQRDYTALYLKKL
jgi:hypothetical protein